MEDQICVSVIIPCYNHGQFIREAISSVEQCDPRLHEIIIVNDGSTESHTLQVMSELESQGYHVINQTNQGLGASRNNGIRASRGRYILPLDADNRIHPAYIVKGIEILDRFPDISVVYGKPEYFGEAPRFPFDPVEEFDLYRLIGRNYIDACAVFRKSVWEECGGYDTKLPVQGYEDWDFWITVATRGHRFHFVDAFLFEYRVRSDSMIQYASSGNNLPQVVAYLDRKHPLVLLQKRVVKLERLVASRDKRMQHLVRSVLWGLVLGYWHLECEMRAKLGCELKPWNGTGAR